MAAAAHPILLRMLCEYIADQVVRQSPPSIEGYETTA
jgi:hypothetical protein